MRVTLTIDDDVAGLLEQATRSSGESFDETVNRFLRAGLLAGNNPHPQPYKIFPRDLGLDAGISCDCIGELLDALEGPEHR